MKIAKFLYLLLYYGFTSRLKTGDSPSNIGAFLNRFLVKRLFLKCGVEVNVRPFAYFSKGAHVSIGDYSMIGERAVISTGAKVYIGNRVLMGPDVLIYTSNHGIKLGIPIMLQADVCADVSIGNDVWIGARAIILPGVTIEDGSVIAAGAVVTRNVEANTIVAGVPARKVSTRKNY